MSQVARADRATDVVMDAPASVSIYLGALLQAGRRPEADAVLRTHEDAVGVAARALADHGSWVVRSEQGAAAPHSYETAESVLEVATHGPGLEVTTSDLHSHLLIAQSIDATETRRAAPLIRSRYFRELGERLHRDLDLPIQKIDGRYEIDAIDKGLIEAFESRPCRQRAMASQVRDPHRGVSGGH